MFYSLSFLLIILTVGFVYQGVSASIDMKKYKAPGRMYDVYGKQMHIYTAGKGNATAVFIAGWGTANPYVDFSPLYDKLQKDTKIAVIDRFGYGYSEMTDRERTIDNIVDETHKLLQESGQQPPYIMVGHSLGSLEVIRYAERYPDEVKGIVLLDAGNPEYYSNQKPLITYSKTLQFLRNLGLIRLIYHLNDGLLLETRNHLKLVPNELKEVDEAYNLANIANNSVIDEMRQIQINANKVIKENNGLKMPMTVITADNFGKIEKDWLETQIKLASWSSSGKQVVLQDSKHYIHQYHPDRIAEEILRLSK